MVHLSVENATPTPPQASDAGSAEGGSAAARHAGSTLEWVLRSLLRVRELDEAQRVVVDLVRASSTCQWAALYVEKGGAYRHCRCSPEAHETLGETLPHEAVELVLGGRGVPMVCPPGAAAREHVAADLAVLAPVQLSDGVQALFLLGPALLQSEFAAADLALLHQVADACAIALQNAEQVESLRSQVFVDFLTGCYNRRGFDAHMRVEVGRARRYGRPLSLLLVDIDHFKWINDSMGHPAGDYALRRLGQFLQSAFRTTDWVCRFGGDEFAVIFPETPKDEVARLAERLRVQIASLFPDEALRRGMTASVGVASLPVDGEEPEQLLKAADRAMYRAKGTGRNRVVVA
jgi:diguanylate cyclase (GGDEF)-like protein